MFERFYQARDGHGFAFGTHCWSADPSLYEICGRLGYDYVWIDNEHGGMSHPMIASGIISANASNCAAIVRVPGHCMEDVKPILEMGPTGIIFPMIFTKEDVELAVKAGAIRESVEIIDVEDVPLQYYPGNTCRVKVKAAGDLA